MIRPAKTEALIILGSCGTLVPTPVLAEMARLMAAELRRRGLPDASNYLVKAASAMEG